MWGPQTNDLVLQLRKRHINKVILAGMLANLCVESHLRELLEQGFEVAVVKDATAAPRHPELGDGYKAAVINYGFLANAVLTTDDAVKAMTIGLDQVSATSTRPRNFNIPLLGDTIMIRTMKFSLTLSLFAATAWALGLTSSVSAQQPVRCSTRP